MAKRKPIPKTKRLNPQDRKALSKAQRLSKRFHGNEGHVVELAKKERKPLPRFVVAAGELDDFSYSPKPGSKRSYASWTHESGDRGHGKKGKHKPLLVVDGEGRPAIVAHKSRMRFSGSRGYVG